MKKFFLYIILVLVVSGCSTSPPSNSNNLCSIFKEKPYWYKDAVEVYSKRGVPINIVMAFIKQESGYVSDAKPPMRWFLFIPYGRGSSSYGYSQAQDPVWDDYKSEVGGFFVNRDNFYDSLDFVSWYILKTKKINSIPISNVYLQYINYHDGWGGYRKKLYLNNSKLQRVAKNVELISQKYAVQLKNCNL